MTVHTRSGDLQVLGLADPAGGTVDAATVRKAYHRLAKLVHPDRGRGLQLSNFRLNVKRFCGIGGELRGDSGGVYVV